MRAWRRGAIALACLAILGGGARAAWAQEGTSTATGSAEVGPPAEPPDAVDGLLIYAEHCAACHGPFGRGDGAMAGRLPAPPPSFAGPAFMADARPADAFLAIRDGRLDRLMPPWKDRLSEAQMWSALYGAWSFHLRPERLVAGRDAWTERCADCHGPDAGAGGAAGGPSFDAAWWLHRSQHDAAAAYSAQPAHDDVAPLPAPRLAEALDYARSPSFRPLPFVDLRAGGRVEGTVRNGTGGASSVAGARVSLVPTRDGVPGILPGRALSLTLAADGAFAFDGLLAGPGMRYRPIAQYGGADVIGADAVALEDPAAPARAELTVYEPSSEVALAAPLAQIVYAALPEEGRLSVAEAWMVRNASDRSRSYPPGGAVLSFRLPPGAEDLAFDDARYGAGAVVRAGGVDVMTVLPPGDHPIVFSYRLPYAGSGASLQGRAAVSVERLEVVLLGAEGELTSPELGAARRERRDDQDVAILEGGARQAGAAWTVELAGLPAPAAAAAAPRRLRGWGPDQAKGTWLGLGFLALGGLALALALGGAARGGSGWSPDPWGQLEGVIGRIADLDDARAAGRIDEAAHRRRRADLLARALELAQAARSPADLDPSSPEEATP